MVLSKKSKPSPTTPKNTRTSKSTTDVLDSSTRKRSTRSSNNELRTLTEDDSSEHDDDPLPKSKSGSRTLFSKPQSSVTIMPSEPLLSTEYSDPQWWRVFLDPVDIAALNEFADDSIKFEKLARHFWGRAFLFHRSWSDEEQKEIAEQCLSGYSAKERTHLTSILQSTYLETQEALSRTVVRFARLWIEETEMGSDYFAQYESFRYVPVFILSTHAH